MMMTAECIHELKQNTQTRMEVNQDHTTLLMNEYKINIVMQLINVRSSVF